MRGVLKKQWFPLAIAGAALTAYLRPDLARFLRTWDIFSAGIFLSFFVTGFSLETRSILRQVQGVRAPLAALASSLVIYPLVAWGAALPLLSHEFVIGVCIIATAPVTISSGTIMTAMARGNIPLSLLICIFTNFLAIFTIPLMLTILLQVGSAIDLPVVDMLGGLALKVLLPLGLGQLVRPMLKRFAIRFAPHLSVFQALIIILIIFNAVSSSATKTEGLGASILGLTVFLACLHFFMLLFNYWFGRVLGLDRPSLIAFTIHTSQKTLAVSYIVWAGHFAHSYPAAFIPAIVCQLIQMSTGTFVAEYFRTRR